MLPPFFAFFDWLLCVLHNKSIDSRSKRKQWKRWQWSHRDHNGWIVGRRLLQHSTHADSLTLPLVLVPGRRVSSTLQSRVCVYIAMSRVGLFCFFVDCADDISFIRLESTEKKQRRLTRRRCNGCGFLARDCAALVLTGVVAATCSRRRMPCGTLSMATLWRSVVFFRWLCVVWISLTIQ